MLLFITTPIFFETIKNHSTYYSMQKKEYLKIVFILGLLTAIGPFSIDMYLPGFAAIAKDLHTSVANVSMTLSSYFIGISAGQLLYGPLLDRFGRKKPLFFGMLIYILATLGCIFVKDIDIFIVLRLLQAIGTCSAIVASVAMVPDYFAEKDTPKIFSKLMLVMGLSPMLAPTIGGFIIQDYGWHTIFLILMCMGVFILIASVAGLPNRDKPNASVSLKPLPIIANYWEILRTPQFYTYALSGAIAFAGLFSYISASPILFMSIFKVDAKTYGIIFALLALSFIGSGQLNGMLLKRFSSQQLVFGALLFQTCISILFLLLATNNLLALYSTIAMLFLFLTCLGISNPNCAGLSLAPFSKNAGSSSSLMGAIQLGLGAITSFIVGVFVKDSLIPMVAVLAITAIGSFIVLNITKGRIKQKNYSAQFGIY